LQDLNLDKNGLPPMEVARVILRAITSKNVPPESRYLVGDDAFKLMKIKRASPIKNLED
jgi:hypothetical protein